MPWHHFRHIKRAIYSLYHVLHCYRITYAYHYDYVSSGMASNNAEAPGLKFHTESRLCESLNENNVFKK